jgi:hypothetical protein
VVSRVRKRNNGEEEEGDTWMEDGTRLSISTTNQNRRWRKEWGGGRRTPSERNPKTEEEQDRLLDEEHDSSSGWLLEKLLDVLVLQLGGGSVSLIVGLLSEGSGSVGKDLLASSLLEEEDFGNEEGSGGDHLEVERRKRKMGKVRT